jgi:hypothetical protein
LISLKAVPPTRILAKAKIDVEAQEIIDEKQSYFHHSVDDWLRTCKGKDEIHAVTAFGD